MKDQVENPNEVIEAVADQHQTDGIDVERVIEDPNKVNRKFANKVLDSWSEFIPEAEEGVSGEARKATAMVLNHMAKAFKEGQMLNSDVFACLDPVEVVEAYFRLIAETMMSMRALKVMHPIAMRAPVAPIPELAKKTTGISDQDEYAVAFSDTVLKAVTRRIAPTIFEQDEGGCSVTPYLVGPEDFRAMLLDDEKRAKVARVFAEELDSHVFNQIAENEDLAPAKAGCDPKALKEAGRAHQVEELAIQQIIEHAPDGFMDARYCHLVISESDARHLGYEDQDTLCDGQITVHVVDYEISGVREDEDGKIENVVPKALLFARASGYLKGGVVLGVLEMMRMTPTFMDMNTGLFSIGFRWRYDIGSAKPEQCVAIRTSLSGLESITGASD